MKRLGIPRGAYLWLIGAVLLSVWGSLFYHLSKLWLGNDNYQYGWAAPFLTLFLVYRRCKNLPAPSRPNSRWAPFVAGFFACMMVPTRIILETNPDWRILLWWSAALTIAFTLTLIYDLGGWSYVKHFAFPVLFVLSAVPWPGLFEVPFTMTLMKIGAFISSELLNFFGVVVLQRGSVLETLNGPIGIDEACSGIKSLQAMVLLGLFVSELSGLEGLKRCYPVFLGWVFAFVTNLLRITALALIGAQFGSNALEYWHDTAGNAAFIVASFLLVLVGFRPRTKGEPPKAGASPSAMELQPGRLVFPLCFLVIVSGSELLNSWWYDTASVRMRQPWRVDWSSVGEKARSLDISKRTLLGLQCDTGSARSWYSEDGRRWTGYFFAWNPGIHALLARGRHSPELCLPATGRKLARDNGYRAFLFGNEFLSVRHMEFDDNGNPLNVFSIVDGSAISKSEEVLDLASFRGRFRPVLRRSREGDRRSLELIAEGYATPDSAWNSAELMLGRLLVLEGQDNSPSPDREAQAGQSASTSVPAVKLR